MRVPSAPVWQPFRPREPEETDTTGNGNGRSPGVESPRKPAGLPRQRRRGMLALGVALVGLGILAGGLLLSSVSHREPVIAVTADIPVGATITRADLTTTMVAVGGGVKTIPARQLGAVTGLVAATTLKAGTLLAPSEITSSQPPASGQQLVTIALKPSQLPASGLRPGDQVLAVATPGTQGGGTAQLIADIPGTVIAVAGPAQDGNMTVDLQVAAADGPDVARQSSTGQIALIVTARGS